MKTADHVEELVVRIQAGDASAWEPFLSAVRESLLRVLARRHVDRHLAEDVVQDSLMAIWKRFESLREPDRVHAWTLSITLNRLRSHLARRSLEFDLPGEPLGNGREPADTLMQRERDHAVEGALRRLAPHYRWPVRLRLLWGFSPSSTCRVLGISRDILRRRLHAGVCKLRRRVRDPNQSPGLVG